MNEQMIPHDTKVDAPLLISVVVCTYNRATLLESLLESLTRQTLSDHCFEVIVVDNNSIDQTKTICQNFEKRFTYFVYSSEPKQGLSHARNNGYRHARGLYVAYLDDECLVPKDWLTTAVKHTQQGRPDMMGGPYGCHYEGPKPAWVRDSYFSTIDELGSSLRKLPPSEYLSGGNMFILRSTLDELGGFDPSFGMSGKRLGYAEEIDFQKRLIAHNPNAERLYDPDLVVSHMVRQEKLNIRFLVRSHYANGISQAALRQDQLGHEYDMPITKMALYIGNQIGKLSNNIVVAALLRDRTRHPFLINALLEQGFEPIERIGFALAARQLCRDKAQNRAKGW